jgi:hypothetical protein
MPVTLSYESSRVMKPTDRHRFHHHQFVQVAALLCIDRDVAIEPQAGRVLAHGLIGANRKLTGPVPEQHGRQALLCHQRLDGFGKRAGGNDVIALVNDVVH